MMTRDVCTVTVGINNQHHMVMFTTMIGENRQLVTNEPVEFEK